MADVRLELRWTGEGLVFDGGSPDGPRLTVDGDGAAGTSPMQTMLLGVAGCTSADVVEILAKMRVPLEALDVRVEADRVAEPPRRYTRIRLRYRARGVPAGAEAKLRRAVALSHETYCSALHSLRPDIEVETEIVLD